MIPTYQIEHLPFRRRYLHGLGNLVVSDAGDFALLSEVDYQTFLVSPDKLPLPLLAELKAKFFLKSPSSAGMTRLLKSRIASRKETVLSGPSLHIIVPTLSCAHSCKYCQVSRSLSESGYTMKVEDLDSACRTIFESPAQALTVEFQGGDPLVRYDLVRRAIETISQFNSIEKRSIRFIVASTLHQLDESMCEFFKEHSVFLSTSIDGPSELHNKNRPIPTRDSYQRTIAGISRARQLISEKAVSALMTTTRTSLDFPEDIVDEYVKLGFDEIFIRPLSLYGFAKKNIRSIGYSLEKFQAFYKRALDRVLFWNENGVDIREVTASILLNKMLCPFDAGYVDLQNPTGAGTAVLVYNYDGYVYPSDEARMLAETGDHSLRTGRIGDAMSKFSRSQTQQHLLRASQISETACKKCSYNTYCGPDPIGAYGQFGDLYSSVELTDHCLNNTWLFDHLFSRFIAKSEFEQIAFKWAQPLSNGELVDA